ncbi:uncharacterized protein sS8_1533 [Methylocaldum marinum]|uniref:Uncharacterized protein n=1 Tax=Methylocaldum marinum TaxID=1432792 RepID=A0A250KPP1_9GAMM|nr:hypothetical protein [Methylocaldum marinum]BBA33492.1 uncharacterized protein sS8_1533 [Methylocaldum marinum]
MKLTQQAGGPAASPELPAFPSSRPFMVHCENIDPPIRRRGRKPDNPHRNATLMPAHLEFGDERREATVVIGLPGHAGKLPQRLAEAHDTHTAPDNLARP